MRLLEESRIIWGYTALIGGAVDGPGLVVLTQFTLDRQTEDYLNRFEAAVRRCPKVQDCYLMTGTADYLVKLKVSDAADYERLQGCAVAAAGGRPAAIELRHADRRGRRPAALKGATP